MYPKSPCGGKSYGVVCGVSMLRCKSIKRTKLYTRVGWRKSNSNQKYLEVHGRLSKKKSSTHIFRAHMTTDYLRTVVVHPNSKSKNRVYGKPRVVKSAGKL